MSIVTTEAADVVVMDSSLAKVDEFLHISDRMRRIALQSALGGMLVSVLGMMLAAAALFCTVAGYFGLQPVSKYAREVWDFVNLYSKTRGVNRFPALIRALNLLRVRPGDKVPVDGILVDGAVVG